MACCASTMLDVQAPAKDCRAVCTRFTNLRLPEGSQIQKLTLFRSGGGLPRPELMEAPPCDTGDGYEKDSFLHNRIRGSNHAGYQYCSPTTMGKMV